MKTKAPTMADLGEFGLIRAIQDHCLFSQNKIIKGIGDDCAVIGPYEGRVFLITTDLLVEDVHFVLKNILPEHLGEKALNVNLSDIAAMGGIPLHAFISVAAPRSLPSEFILNVYRGLKKSCKKYCVNILGGDTSASLDRLMINITVMGEALQDDVLFRSGAKPGDWIFVTGTIGDSEGGLRILQGKETIDEPHASALIRAHNRPMPFLEVGRRIAQSHLASAMMDLSDGLAPDLRHICDASHVGAKLFQEKMPFSKSLMAFCDVNGLDPYDLALYGGEDYKLLATVPQKNVEGFLKLFEKEKPFIFHVGEIMAEQGIRLALSGGKTEALEAGGFEHFAATLI